MRFCTGTCSSSDDPDRFAIFTTMDPQRKRIGTFLMLAFGISWSIAGIGIALGVTPANQLAYLVMAGSFMFGPAFAAIIQQRLIDRAPWRGLGIGFGEVRWGQVAWSAAMGLAIVPLAMMVSWVLGDGLGIEAFGHVSITQERMLVSMEQATRAAGMEGQAVSGPLKDVQLPGAAWLLVLLGGALLAACTVNLPAMMGEELGWRGYLYQATAHRSGLRRVVFTGVVWGLWHAPLIALGHNYPDHPVAGIGLMVLFCVLLAVPFDRARQRSGTVWSAALLHGCINGSAGAYMLFAWDGAALVNSPVGLAGFIALALLTASVLAFDPVYRSGFLRAVPVAQIAQDPE